MKNNLVRPSPSPSLFLLNAGYLTYLHSACGILYSIWIGSSSISLPRKKKREDTMSWPTSTHSVLSHPLLQGSSSSYPQFIHPVPSLIHLHHSQSWSDIVLCHRVSSTISHLQSTLRLRSHPLTQQRGPHLPSPSPHLPHLQNLNSDLTIRRLRTPIQRHADARVHTLPACPTHYCRKTSYALDPGSFPPLSTAHVSDRVCSFIYVDRNCFGTSGTLNEHETTSASVAQRERRVPKPVSWPSLMATTQRWRRWISASPNCVGSGTLIPSHPKRILAKSTSTSWRRWPVSVRQHTRSRPISGC